MPFTYRWSREVFPTPLAISSPQRTRRVGGRTLSAEDADFGFEAVRHRCEIYVGNRNGFFDSWYDESFPELLNDGHREKA